MIPLNTFDDLQAIVAIPERYREPFTDNIHYRPDAILAYLRVWGATSDDPKAIVTLVDNLVSSPGFDIHNCLGVEALIVEQKPPHDPQYHYYFGVNTKGENRQSREEF